MRLKVRYFQSTLQELQERSSAGDACETLQVATLVRKLLMEGTPLLDVMNRKHPIPIIFRVRQSLDLEADGPQRAIWLAGGDLDPAMPVHPQRPMLDLRRDGFLAHEVGRVYGQQIRVCDLVELVAGALNGTVPDTPHMREQVLADVATAYSSFVGVQCSTMPLVVQIAELLRGIGRVTARAAEALSRRIGTETEHRKIAG